MDLLRANDHPAGYPYPLAPFPSTFASPLGLEMPLRAPERTLPSIHSLNLPGLSPSTFSHSGISFNTATQPSTPQPRQTRSRSSTLDGSSTRNRKFSLTSTLQGLASRFGGQTERSSEADDVAYGADREVGTNGTKDRECACCPLPAKRRGPGGVRTFGDPNWIRLARCSNCGLSFHRKIRRLENTGAAESQVVDAVKSFISKRRAYTLAKSSGADDERQVAPGSSNTSPALSVAMDEDGSSRSASPSTPRSPQLGQVHAYQPISFARHPSPPLSSAAHALYPSPPTTYYPSPASSNYPSTSTSSSERASHAEDAFIRPGHTSPTFETSFTRYQHPYPSKEHPFRFPAFQATSGLAKGQRG